MAEETSIDLDVIVQQLAPYLPGIIQTIGVAGQAKTDEEGKVTPGDVKAASIGLELVVKHLTGKGSSRAADILKGLAALPKDDNPTAS